MQRVNFEYHTVTIMLYLQHGMKPKTSASTKHFVPVCFKGEVWHLIIFGTMWYSLSSFTIFITWDFSCLTSTPALIYDCCCNMIHKCIHTIKLPISWCTMSTWHVFWDSPYVIRAMILSSYNIQQGNVQLDIWALIQS